MLEIWGSRGRQDGIKRRGNRIMYIVSTWDEREGLRTGFRPIVKMRNSSLGSRNDTFTWQVLLTELLFSTNMFLATVSSLICNPSCKTLPFLSLPLTLPPSFTPKESSPHSPPPSPSPSYSPRLMSNRPHHPEYTVYPASNS